jgi:MFS family permease
MHSNTLSGRQLAIIAALALGRIGFGFQIQTVGSLGPDLMDLFQLDFAALGTLIGVYMLPGTFVALPLGLLGRRFGDRLVVGAGMMLMALGGALAAGIGTPQGIGIGRMVCGVGAVAMIIMQGKIIADWFQGRLFMPVLGIAVGSYPIGLGLGQLVQPPLAHAYGWQMPFWVGAAGMAATAALFIAGYRPAPGVAPVPRQFSFPSRREMLLVAVAGMIWTFYTSSYTSYLSYLPSLMASRGDGLALTGLAVTLATWGNVPGNMVGGALANRLGGLRVFLFGTLALAVAMVGTGLTHWAVLCAAILGILGSFHPSVIVALGTLSARPENRAVGLSLFYTAYYAVNSVGPAFCGWIADRVGSPAGAMFAAAALTMVALPAYLLHRRLIPHASLLARP